MKPLCLLLFVSLELASIPPAMGQTRVNPLQAPWRQINWEACGGAPSSGTRLSMSQIQPPSGVSSPCWPAEIEAAARNVINARCTRCHGADLIPGDTHLVGFLDLRSYPAMRRGGTRGPAIRPGDPMGSLIYRFASRWQLGAGPGGNSPVPTIRVQLADGSAGVGIEVSAGFRIVPPDSAEESIAMPPFFPLLDFELLALRDWIAVGAPTISEEREPLRVSIRVTQQ